MKRTAYRYIPVLAALAVMSVSCNKSELTDAGSNRAVSDDSLIGYQLGSSAVQESKSGSLEQGAITLKSADGSYSLTLYRSAAPTADPVQESKSAPVTGATLDSRYNDGSLQILALKDDGSAYIPQQKLIFASREPGSSTSLWKTATDYQWPEDNLNFWSWAPYSETAAAGKLSNAAVAEGKLGFSYECPTTSAEAQSDVLVAYSTASSSTKGNVNLLYKHALSGVVFQVDRANKCTIKSVSLSDVYSKGDCSFDGTNVSWSNQSEPVEFTETFNKAIDEYLQEDYANPQSLSTAEADADKTFFLIPQSATEDKKVTMTVVLRLDGASEDLTLSAELSPSDAIWEAGWTYTYGLVLVDKLVVSVDDNVTEKRKSGLVIANTDESEAKCYMRAIIMGNWYDDSDKIVASWKVNQGSFDATFPTVAGVASTNNWTLGTDGFYYYKYPVNPGDVTGQTESDPDGDPLFLTYDAPANARVAGAHLKIKIVAQGVKWDEEKEWAAEAWGSEAAGYLSVSEKE